MGVTDPGIQFNKFYLDLCDVMLLTDLCICAYGASAAGGSVIDELSTISAEAKVGHSQPAKLMRAGSEAHRDSVLVLAGGLPDRDG